MSNRSKNIGQQIRVDLDAAAAINEIREALGNPDKKTLASAIIRRAVQQVKAKELSFVNGALIPSSKIAA